MAGKWPALCSRHVALALDELSKNTLIDLVYDIAEPSARLEKGDAIEDDDVLLWIQKKLEPVHQARKQRAIDLVAIGQQRFQNWKASWENHHSARGHEGPLESCPVCKVGEML